MISAAKALLIRGANLCLSVLVTRRSTYVKRNQTKQPRYALADHTSLHLQFCML